MEQSHSWVLLKLKAKLVGMIALIGKSLPGGWASYSPTAFLLSPTLIGSTRWHPTLLTVISHGDIILSSWKGCSWCMDESLLASTLYGYMRVGWTTSAWVDKKSVSGQTWWEWKRTYCFLGVPESKSPVDQHTQCVESHKVEKSQWFVIVLTRNLSRKQHTRRFPASDCKSRTSHAFLA